MPTRREIGELGEQMAASYLQSRGWHILFRNWRYKKAEIDIIALESEQLVFVEVKTRSTEYFGPPEGFVSPRQAAILLDAAAAFMRTHGYEWEIRFDIIGVTKKQHCCCLKHYRDAFFYQWE